MLLMPGGKNLPESEADPLTIDLIGRIWDAEKPDLVVFAGGQLYHGIPGSGVGGR